MNQLKIITDSGGAHGVMAIIIGNGFKRNV